MQMRQKGQEYNGVTLLELLIVIGIISIMSAVVYVSFTPARNQARLKAAQTEVVATIKQAQSYALQGKMAISGTKSGQVPARYGFKFLSDNQTYRIFYCTACGGLDDETVEEFSLASNGVSLTSPAYGSTRFDMDVPNGNYCLPSSLSMTLGLSGISKTITVEKGGSITESQ
jgi:prepilin-type N-terminal cleavage/methylation domain-containing protein